MTFPQIWNKAFPSLSFLFSEAEIIIRRTHLRKSEQNWVWVVVSIPQGVVQSVFEILELKSQLNASLNEGEDKIFLNSNPGWSK